MLTDDCACRLRQYFADNPSALSRPAQTTDEVWSVEDVVALERQIEAEGTPLLVLMQRAGAALAQVVQEVAKTSGASAASPVVILAGSGNNGGDGWVAAEVLADAGVPVCLVAVKGPDELRAEPARTAAIEACRVIDAVVNPQVEEVCRLVEGASVVVDALLGTGLVAGVVKEPYASWIDAINRAAARVPVIAADVPSAGLVQADITVCMLRLKAAARADMTLLASLE